MKKLYILIGLLMMFPKTGNAGVLSNIGSDLYNNTRVTLLQSAYPAYFYDLGAGSSKGSQGGVIDHVITYKFISADMGWRSAFDGGAGFGVGGVGIQLDQLASLVLPTAVKYVNSIIPPSAQGFWQALFVGLDTGWDTETGAFRYAFHTGINFAWGNQ